MSAGAALASALGVFVATLVWAIRSKGLARRPLVLALLALGFAPALLVVAEGAGVVTIPRIRFERPLLAALSTPFVVFVALRLLALPARLSRRRRTLIELLTGIATLCAALAAGGLAIGRPLDRLTVVVLLDRSRSIDLVPNASNRIAAELLAAEAEMRPEDRIARVVFGATAAIEETARGKDAPRAAHRAEIARDGTDIAAGLRQALLAIPPDSAARIALVSDGVATQGDTHAAALSAAALGVPVDVVPLDQGRPPNVRVAGFRAPSRAALGEALDLKVVTESSAEAEVELRLYRDGELVRRGTTRLRRGQDVIALREVAQAPGLHRYTVELGVHDSARDLTPADNAESTFVRVQGPSTALVLDASPERARPLVSALEDAGFQVEIASAPAAPADVAGFARHDLVVLGEIPALDFSPSQLDALAAFVRDLGGGLLLLGGEQSLGPGGYARTAIEEVSPTAFDLKQERRRASLAEVIAVDFSGSMAAKAGEHTKLELANEAAVRSADLLGEGDRLGVLHVDAAPHWTVPLAPVVDKAKIAERIRAVGPGGGGIFVDLTLETAYAALRKETTQLKHLLLFADGSDAEERTRAPALVARAKAAGITTSVVALGSGKDVTALERLATLGGGRFYLIEDARRLPAVFAQETVLASRSAINEVRFVPAPRAAGPALRGIDFGAAPPLTGYVVTIPKNRAEVHLAGPEGDPVLATWSVGTGRAGVFTSDFSNRWGHAWTSWEGASRLFGQLSRQLARRAEDPRVRLQAEFENGGLAIRATALDARGRRDTFRRLRVVVSGPEGYQRTAPLEVIGPGHFGLELSPSRPGAYVMTLVDDVTGEPLATGGAVLASGIEQRPVGTDRALLGRVATLTGGKVRDTLAGIFRERERRRFAYSPLEPTLLATCAAALLLAVTARRLFVSIPRLRRATIERRSSASAASITGTLAALRARKRKARGEPAPPSEQTAEAAQPSAHEPSAGSPPRAATPAPKPPLRPPERGRTAAEILLERRRRRLR